MTDEHITALPVAAAASASGAKWYVIHAGKEALKIGGGVLIALVAFVALWAFTKPTNTAQPVAKHGAEPEPGKAHSAEALYALVSPGVVTITLKNDNGENVGVGSGFFLKDDLLHGRDDLVSPGFIKFRSEQEGVPVQVGYLATNYHVIQPAVDADIALADGSKASILGVVTENESADLAVLSVLVFSAKSLTQLPLGDEPARVGAAVFAIGSPRGLANSLSAGIVSGIREIKPGVSWLQTTAPISLGSSGGPLLSTDGKVVGVTTAVRRDGQNLNFAVPVSELRQLLTAPYRKRELSQGRSLQHLKITAFLQLPFIVDSKKDDYAEILRKAWIHIGDSNYDDAIAALEGARPSVPPEFSYLCYFLLGQAHYRLAWKAAASATTVEEVRAVHRNSKHGRSALESLNEAQRLNPTFAPTYESLYFCHQGAGQREEALLAANSLVKLMPKYARGYFNRGFCYHQLDKFEFALADLQDSLKLNPRDQEAHYEIGCVWSALQEYEKAIDSFNTALSLKHTPPICHYMIGYANEKARKYQQAIIAYEKARIGQTGGFSDDCKERIAICRKLMR